MAVPTTWADISTTAASNSPAGTEDRTTADDYLRDAYARLKTLYNYSDSATTFTPTDGSGAGLSFSGVVGRYYKVGKLVFFTLSVTYPSTASSASAVIGDLPHTSESSNPWAVAAVVGTDAVAQARVNVNSTSIALFAAAGAAATNANMSTKVITVSGVYEAAA